jgi:hypothetical protein
MRRVGTARPAAVHVAAHVALACAVALAADAATATGGLPPGPLPFFVATGSADSGFRPGDRELATWALEMWVRESRGTVTLQPVVEDRARFRVYWVPPTDTTFGEMKRMMVGGQPGAAVYVRADVEALGEAIASRAKQDVLWRDTIVFLTCLHELGHAFGLPHTADDRDIMYSFGYGGDIVEYFARHRRKLKGRADLRTVSGLSSADVQHFQALLAK